MTFEGRIVSGFAPTAPASEPQIAGELSSPAAKPRRQWKRPRGKPIYAIWATRDEIIVPRFRSIGYLAQSRLIQKAQAGDSHAAKAVWLQNARLAYTVINRHRARPGLMADAFQEAQLGLGRAIRHFDVERLFEFSTYSFAVMSRAISRHRTLPGCAARVPGAVISGYAKFRSRVVHARTRGDWFDAREEYLTQHPGRYQRLLRLHALAAPRSTRAARSVPSAEDSPDAGLLGIDLASDLGAALASLDPRRRMVIDRRYGFDERPIETLEQIGARVGLTKERVRQIQMAAEDAIRTFLADRGWDGGLAPLPGIC